ncbi:thioredoxin domain-containing protein [Candidatus Peregrinibacteria bacterium]|nr:thioredoxin domain-containing protein [Candidatus Peregrinibacteria bacterium]
MIEKKDLGLVLAIVFASAAVSGSLVFFGMRLNGGGGDVSVDKIEQAFNSFAKKQQQQQQDLAQQQEAQGDQLAEEMAKNVKPVDKTRDHVRGNPDAEITMITYSDYECPFCKKFHPTGNKVMAAYGDKINWVYRHYPLSFHDPMATTEAMAAECVAEFGGSDKFWSYTDMIYEKTSSNGDGLTMDQLYAFAKDLGLNEASFKECLTSQKYLSKVQNDIAEGEKAGVDGTPGNIIMNNKTGKVKVVSGAQPLSKFQTAIDALLNS